MTSSNGDDGNSESILSAFLKQTASDERLGDLIADEVSADVSATELDPVRRERARAAVSRGMFDGRIARARAGLVGSLGAFGTALRRIREEARCTEAQMAKRAGIEAGLWERLEDQRTQADALAIDELASVVETVQLKRSDLRATLRAQNVRLLSGGQASFRSEYLGGVSSKAAHEDLMAALSDEGGSGSGRLSEDEIDALVERIADILRRRGRDDLL